MFPAFLSSVPVEPDAYREYVKRRSKPEADLPVARRPLLSRVFHWVIGPAHADQPFLNVMVLFIVVVFVLFPLFMAALFVVGGTAFLMQGLATGWPVNRPSPSAWIASGLFWGVPAAWLLIRRVRQVVQPRTRLVAYLLTTSLTLGLRFIPTRPRTAGDTLRTVDRLICLVLICYGAIWLLRAWRSRRHN